MTLHTGELLADDLVSLRPPDPAATRAAAASVDVAGSAEHWLRAAQDHDNVYYFAVHAGDRLVGQILLHDVDQTTGEALVAYHLFDPADRGRGIGSRALLLLQRFVQERTTLRRLVVITSRDNAASRRIAEKAGFRHVGPPREDPTGVCLLWDIPRASSVDGD